MTTPNENYRLSLFYSHSVSVFLCHIYHKMCIRDRHKDVYRTVIVGIDTVCHDDGVTITRFVVFVDNQLFVRFVVVLNEFLGAEPVSYTQLRRRDSSSLFR